MATLRIGTRGSQLALYQANAVAALLAARTGTTCEVVVITTSGDRLAEATLSTIGGKRVFVKEIEDALLAGAVDLAVHSSKDMPAVLPPGLDIAAVLPREDARDAVVLKAGIAATDGFTIETLVRTLGRAPRIGTSSVRRVAQLARLWPGARFGPVRGNLNTRLRKLDGGEFDALVLACAGLIRLEHAHRIGLALPIDACVPAPGQGIIAVEVRGDDSRVRDIVSRIDDPTAGAALAAERSLVARLGGGCQMPIGAYAGIRGETMSMHALVASLDGGQVSRVVVEGTRHDPRELGTRAAEALLAEGAGEILGDVLRAHAAVDGLQP